MMVLMTVAMPSAGRVVRMLQRSQDPTRTARLISTSRAVMLQVVPVLQVVRQRACVWEAAASARQRLLARRPPNPMPAPWNVAHGRCRCAAARLTPPSGASSANTP